MWSMAAVWLACGERTLSMRGGAAVESVLRAQYCSSRVGCSSRASCGAIVLSQCLQCLRLLEELLLDSLRGGDGG